MKRFTKLPFILNRNQAGNEDQSSPAEKPFFYLLTLALVFVYIVTLINNPNLHLTLPLIIFTALMIVHTTLHWFLLWLEKYPQLLWGYLITQGLLVFILCWLGNYFGTIIGLYIALISETVGIFRNLRKALPSMIVLLGMSLINFVLAEGIESITWWAIVIFPTSIFTTIYIILYGRQAEARDQAQKLLKELEIANRQLTEYATRVEELTLTTERQRMARELHETLSQGLAGLILQLEAVDAHLSNQRNERAQEIVRQTMQKARATLIEARAAIENLRNARSADLREAILEEIDHFTQATGIPCTAEIQSFGEIPATIQEAIHRTVAEGLSNITRHAQAQQAGVHLSMDTRSLKLEIWDDGCGFNPETASATGHYGLLGIRERARLSGGTLTIESQLGAGTRLLLRFPIPVEDQTSSRSI